MVQASLLVLARAAGLARLRKAPITLSQKAADRIRELLSKRDKVTTFCYPLARTTFRSEQGLEAPAIFCRSICVLASKDVAVMVLPTH